MTSKLGSEKKLTGIVPLYALLAQIRQLEFSSRSGPASRNAWSGKGVGNVEIAREFVEEIAPLPWKEDLACPGNMTQTPDIVFLEQGQFLLEGQSASVNFSNRYRWRLNPDGSVLSLSHERRGRDAAVFLFDLIPDTQRGPDHFISREAHLCIDDLYAATLTITRDADLEPCGFDLDWRITGPRKDEHLAYRYRC